MLVNETTNGTFNAGYNRNELFDMMLDETTTQYAVATGRTVPVCIHAYVFCKKAEGNGMVKVTRRCKLSFAGLTEDKRLIITNGKDNFVMESDAFMRANFRMEKVPQIAD